MPAINFQPRFADIVESGRKTQTIRKSNRFKVGDTVQLYTGQRTKQCRKLGEGVVTVISPIRLYRSPALKMYARTIYGGRILSPVGVNNVAIADGFCDANDMFKWFEEQHGLPFDGWLIRWRLNR